MCLLILEHTSFGYVQREVSLLDIYSLCIIFFILLYLYIACMITAFSEFSLCILLMRSAGIRALRLPSAPATANKAADLAAQLPF